MTEKNSSTDSRLVMSILIGAVILIVGLSIFLTLRFINKPPSIPATPIATFLLTANPFIPTPTPIAPATVTGFPTVTPEGIPFALLYPIDIVGDDITDPTDGLLVRTGPGTECGPDDSFCNLSFNDLGELYKVYGGDPPDVLTLYGSDESGEWCSIGLDDEYWVKCEFTMPALPEYCESAAAISPFIQECETGDAG